MKRLIFVCVIVLFGWSVVCAAQGEAPDPKQKFAQAQKQNTEAMHRLMWKSQTELKVKGETKKVKLEQIRFAPDGQQQKILIEESQPPQAQQKQEGGGRRGARVKQKIIENKKEDFAELMQNLVALAQSYAHMQQQQMQAFVQKATFSPGAGAMEGSLKVSASGVIQAEDSMNLWLDQQTMLMQRVEINSSLEKKPVTLRVDYMRLPNGPAVPSKTTLQYPDKEILLTIDNFDHQPYEAQ